MTGIDIPCFPHQEIYNRKVKMDDIGSHTHEARD
jgi:hypothetical protein